MIKLLDGARFPNSVIGKLGTFGLVRGRVGNRLECEACRAYGGLVTFGVASAISMSLPASAAAPSALGVSIHPPSHNMHEYCN